MNITNFFKRHNNKPQTTEKRFFFHRVETDPKTNEKIDRWEEVAAEIYGWVAIYANGTYLAQFDTTSPIPKEQFGDNAYLFHQFKEIDQSRLHMFKLVKLTDETKEFTLLFNAASMKLIHKYVRYHLYLNTPYEDHSTAYCFGYEKQLSSGFTHKFFNMIMPDDILIATEDTNLIQIINPEAEEYVQKFIDEEEKKSQEEAQKKKEHLAKLQAEIDAKSRKAKK